MGKEFKMSTATIEHDTDDDARDLRDVLKELGDLLMIPVAERWTYQKARINHLTAVRDRRIAELGEKRSDLLREMGIDPDGADDNDDDLTIEQLEEKLAGVQGSDGYAAARKARLNNLICMKVQAARACEEHKAEEAARAARPAATPVAPALALNFAEVFRDAVGITVVLKWHSEDVKALKAASFTFMSFMMQEKAVSATCSPTVKFVDYGYGDLMDAEVTFNLTARSNLYDEACMDAALALSKRVSGTAASMIRKLAAYIGQDADGLAIRQMM